jgi:hypothetical protein
MALSRFMEGPWIAGFEIAVTDLSKHHRLKCLCQSIFRRQRATYHTTRKTSHSPRQLLASSPSTPRSTVFSKLRTRKIVANACTFLASYNATLVWHRQYQYTQCAASWHARARGEMPKHWRTTSFYMSEQPIESCPQYHSQPSSPTLDVLAAWCWRPRSSKLVLPHDKDSIRSGSYYKPR